MIDDRKANMPFSVLAVAILLMASVASAIVADHSRSGSNVDMTADSASALERSIEDITSYVEQELGVIILDISKDDSLGSLENRAEEFEKRAYGWMDERFPMGSGGMTADLLYREFELKAESMEVLQYEGEVGGFTPAYLRGTGTMELKVHSEFGSSGKTVEISTDGSYALPLASERGSMFERMTEDGGISISQIMSYELSSLAQYRVLNGYGAVTKYGSKGTESIITSDDVREAYENALELIGIICFRDSDGNLASDRADLADMMAGDSIIIDRASFYGQVMMSSIDDIALKWFDYLCGNYILDDLDRKLSMERWALDALINFFTGDDVFGAGSYIKDAMKEAGIKESTYRFPGSGKTTLSVGGHTITVDNPTVDVLGQSWIEFFNVHYRMGNSYIQDTIRQILNSAAASLFESDYPPIVLHLDPSDGIAFMDQITEAYRSLTAECMSAVDNAVIESLESKSFSDPFYAAIAETVMKHAEELADTQEFRKRIEENLRQLAGDDTDLLMGSPEVDRAVRSYVSKVYSDLSVYDSLREKEGSGPGLLERVLTDIVSFGLSASGISDSVPENIGTLLDEIAAESSTSPYWGPTDLPDSHCFMLMDGEDNVSMEYLSLTYESAPIVHEPRLLKDKCTHITGLMEDVCAAYSATYEIRLSDCISYRVEGKNSLSSAMGSSITSASCGTITNDITIEVSVASSWALVGIDYSPSNTIVSDAWATIEKYLEPILEPLREIIEMVKDFIDVVSGCVMEIARYVSDIIMDLYNRMMEPISIVAEWIETQLSEMIGDGVLDVFYSLNLSNQNFGFEYLGYRFEIKLDLASLITNVKTLFTATLSGPIAGMSVVASITAKVNGEMNANNVFVTGKATVSSDGWKVKLTVDPLMKSSKHLITVSADIGDTDITLIMPDLEDYNELGFTLSRLPGIGSAISSIPIPGLGVNIGLDAGLSIKYTAPFSKGLVINEYETNPKGDDSGHEWVELLNNSDQSIELDGYTLTAASDRKKVMKLSGSISPGEFMVIDTSFSLVNSSGKVTKNGDGVTLKDSEGTVIDKTGTHKDESDDSRTWQRSYDAAGDWEFKDATMGRSNGSFMSSKLMTAEVAKDIMVRSVQSAFDEVGSITDLESMQEVIKLTVKSAVDTVIKKVAGCLVEASVFVKVDVLDPTSSASAGIRIALRCDSDLVEDVLKYIAGKIESVALSMKNPYRINGVAAFTDNIDLEVTFDAKVQYPSILARSLETTPKVDLGITFRTNLSALSRIIGKDVGTPGVECGIRVIDCPAIIIPSKLSPKSGMVHDLWLLKVNVEWK